MRPESLEAWRALRERYGNRDESWVDRGTLLAPGGLNHRDHWATLPDSHRDSNSQRLALAGGSAAPRLHIICELGLRQA